MRVVMWQLEKAGPPVLSGAAAARKALARRGRRVGALRGSQPPCQTQVLSVRDLDNQVLSLDESQLARVQASMHLTLSVTLLS